jgi:hypothetical protein
MQIKNNYQLEWEVVSRYGIPIDSGMGIFNGDMGRILEVNENASTLVVEYDDQRRVTYPFSLLEELELAYAITIHKSQGLSLGSVYLRLGRGCFDHGQLYTALSRCRTLSGLQIDRPVTPEDLIIDESVMRFHSELETRPRSEPWDARWYEEAMRYYLRRLETGEGGIIPRKMTQAEFDFTPRVCQHPDLTKLLRLHESGLINKYDAPVLQPIVSNVIDGVGVKEDELALVHRLIAKYED